MSKRDYYDVLGVDKGADEQSIRSAFRKKAGDYHPDRHPNASPDEKKKMEEKFKELGEAYDVGLWGGGGGRGGSRARAGSDLRAEVELSFEEAAFGKEIEIPVQALGQCQACHGSGAKKGSQPVSCSRCGGQGRVRMSQGFFNVVTACPDCGGSGQVIKDACPECRGQGRLRTKRSVKVAIPAGVDTGIQIRKRGEGEAGPNGGPSGDLYVVVSVRQHSIFSRDGEDVLCELPLSFTQAALGCEAEVPTLEGKAKVKIPPGTQSGKLFSLKNKGVASLNGRGRGNQIITVFVETPSQLSAKQKELLEEFAKISGEDSTPRRKSFLDHAKEFFN